MYGGSTGGWEALRPRSFIPMSITGRWGACPDPIDFRAYTVVNIYSTRTLTTPKHPGNNTPARQRNYLGELRPPWKI